MTRNAVWTLSNLCRGKNPPTDFEAVAPGECPFASNDRSVASAALARARRAHARVAGIPVLARLLHHADADVLSDACWALSYLSDGPSEKIQAVIDAGVCRRLVELLM